MASSHDFLPLCQERFLDAPIRPERLEILHQARFLVENTGEHAEAHAAVHITP
jgi:hypothetical protein